MAESQSMTTPEVVAKTLITEHSDFLRDAVAAVAAQLMEAEISAEIGAGRGEVTGTRSTHRNGYRPRPWATRVGEIELAVPRKRSGESYFPSFLEPRKRSEKALLGVVMEAYVNGVSPGRSTTWSQSSASTWARTRCRASAVSSTSRWRRFAPDRSREISPTSGSTPST
jgi:transposase-like protein